MLVFDEVSIDDMLDFYLKCLKKRVAMKIEEVEEKDGYRL